jgi:hypothetical protein
MYDIAADYCSCLKQTSSIQLEASGTSALTNKISSWMESLQSTFFSCIGQQTDHNECVAKFVRAKAQTHKQNYEFDL